MENVKKLLIEWCEITTCSCVVDVFLAKTICGKCFWAILLFTGVTLTLWQTVTLFNDFSQSNTFQTSLAVKTESIPFPNVTLCNINRIDSTKIGSFVNDTCLLSYALLPAALNYMWKDSYTDTLPELENRWKKAKQILNVTDLKKFFHTYGMSCEDTFIACRWKFGPLNCCQIATEVITSYGRCWTIQPPADPNGQFPFQQIPGVYNGLQIILNPNLDKYVKNLVVNNFIEEGFFLDIGYVQQNNMDNFKVLQPGVHAYVAMKASHQVLNFPQIPIWPLHCRLDTTFKYLATGYSIQNCNDECDLDYVLRQCNCSTLSITNPGYEVCDSSEMWKCIVPLYQKTDYVASIKQCTQTNCLQTCSPYWTVDTSMSSTNFVGKHVTQDFSDLFAYSHVPNLSSTTAKTFIALNVYFETLDYIEVQTQETTPIFVFIGNVGGQLSLWLGISLITIVQAASYLIACCFTVIKQKGFFSRNTKISVLAKDPHHTTK